MIVQPENGLRASTPSRLSIIIPNYNYGEFLAASISSALAIDWQAKEIIVVDDGSTDHSHNVMLSFGGRIVSIFQPNGGQYAACNTGFARSNGDAILFLDSDDTVLPSIMKEAEECWTPRTSKVQFAMQIVDASGNSTGSTFPKYHRLPKPDEIRRWQRSTVYYVTAPGSGNIYARKFLDEIFPLKNEGTPTADSYCIAMAPFYGDVMTVNRPLVNYRIHGRNDTAMSEVHVGRIRRDLDRAQSVLEYTRRRGSSLGYTISAAAPWNSWWFLPYRVASWALDPDHHPIAGENKWRIISLAIRAWLTPQGYGWRASSTLAVWSFAVVLLPRRISRQIVNWRFAPSTRPKFMKSVLQKLGIVGNAGVTER